MSSPNRPEQVLEANELRIVDASGRVRARLGMIGNQDDSVGLHLLRPDGSLAVQIDLVEFPRVRLLDKEGIERLCLDIGNADDEEYAGLSVSGSDGEARITLVVPPSDYGEISITDHNGHTKFLQ